MDSARHIPETGLLYQVERWTPAEAEVWHPWRESLAADQRADLLRLQAVLTGLIAFQRTARPADMGDLGSRSHFQAIRVAYEWALELALPLMRTRAAQSTEPSLRTQQQAPGEPVFSLYALERSLSDALRRTDALLNRPVVDADAFRASSDSFLGELARNCFFRPPQPLEYANAAELIREPHRLAAELDSWRNEAAKMTLWIALLTLLRAHRFLGIADQEIRSERGLLRAFVVVAAVRNELRAWAHFLLTQGVEAFAEELEARLLSLSAAHITDARSEIGRASRELRRLRESVQALATDVHAKARTALDQPLPKLGPGVALALHAERMRAGIREVRETLREAGKDLHRLGIPPETRRAAPRSERAPKNLHQDIWAFRFILRAFVAKSSVAFAAADDWCDAENLGFVEEFVRHFRVFGPRVARASDYPRRETLIRAVSALSKPGSVDGDALNLAMRQCALFAEHLDAALDDIPRSPFAPFDKRKAAAELRGYLAAAKDQALADRAAATGFELLDPVRAHAG